MKTTVKQRVLKLTAFICLLALVFSCVPVMDFGMKVSAASLNTTHNAEVVGNTITMGQSGDRANLNYAAFEMDPYKDITLYFTGQQMPTVRFLANEVNGNSKLTTNTGVIVYGDTDNRLEVATKYVDNSVDKNDDLGIADLDNSANYKMVYQVIRTNDVITGVNVEVHKWNAETSVWDKLDYRGHTVTAEGMGCDLTKPVYVIIMNNVYGGVGEHTITYDRPSAMDAEKVTWDAATKTLSWGKLIGADGYYVKADDGQWIETEALSYTFTDLSYGAHTLSVCANIGGTQGTVIDEEIELVKPAGPGASLNTTSKATVDGNFVSIENSGGRANSNYAAFEMDPYQDEFTIEFTGKGMPTIRYMTNDISPVTDTAGTGSMLRADANNRFEIRHGYGNADGAQTETSFGSLDNASAGKSLEADAQYKLLFRIIRDEAGTITDSNAQLYKMVEGIWVRQFDKSLSTSIEKLGVDLTKPVYVIFYNNLANWTGKPARTEFTFNRPSTMDESSVTWDAATNTLSWARLAGADGYFVKADDGEWIATDDLSYTFKDLGLGTHTFSVCANIGGVKGEAVSQEVTLGEPVILKDAASIRVDGESGIRFTAYIAEGYLDSLNNGVAGIMIHKGALAEGEEITAENYDLWGQARKWAAVSDMEGYRKFNCVVTGVPEEYYALDLAARAYVSYTDSDGKTVYEYSATTATRSLAQVASMALRDPQYTNNEVLTGYVDGAVGSIAVTGNSVIGINDADGEQLTLTLTGKADLAEGSSLDKLVAIWSTSNASVATVDENGVITAHSIGSATITAAVGSSKATFDVTVGMYRATENANGTIMLNGSPDNGTTAAYYVMDHCAVDVNTMYEVSWTGKNFPGLWLGASEERGNYKTTGTGVIVTWDNSYGLAVSSQSYGSGRTSITNQAGQSGTNWTLNTLDDNTKYVMRVGFVANAESNSEYKLQIYVWSVGDNGQMTLLNKKTTSDNYANGVVSGTEYYMMLVNNRAHNPNTFSWRKVTMAGATISGSASSMGQTYFDRNNGSQTAMNYFVTDYKEGDYIEVTFTKGGMPIIRFGYGTVTADSTSTGNATGFMLTNAYNSTRDTTGGSVTLGDLTCWKGYYANATRTNFGDETFGVADLNTAAGTYMVRAGLRNQGDGNYSMVAYFYQVNSDGTLTQMNTVTESLFTVPFGADPYIQIMGNRQTNTQCNWVVKNGGFIESELQFGFYGYAGPSNGQHFENGTTVTDNETGFQNQAGYNTYAEAGMNILLLDGDTAWNDTSENQEKVREILKYASNAGLKVIIHDSRIYKLSQSTEAYAGYGSQSELNSRIAEWMNEYASIKGFYGLQLDDEPSYQQFSAIGAVYKAIKAYDKDCYVQCNLLPLDEGSYASYAAGASKNKYEEAYVSYLTAWLDATGADYVMFDSYPFLDDQIRDAHVRGLQLAANLCKERKVDLYCVAQAGAWTKGNGGEVIRRAPTEADMYWQTNLLMGMGVKEISYFTYQTKKNNTTSEWFVDGASFVKWDGTTTGLYTSMQKLHAEMQLLAPTILRYDFVDMAVYGKSGWFTKNHVIEGVESASSWNKITEVSADISATDYVSTLFISEMYNATTQQYGYMIVNLSEKDKGKAMTPTITFSTNEIAVYQHGERTTQTLTNGVYEVSLNYGEAVFVVVQDSNS